MCLIVKTAGFELVSNTSLTVRSEKCCLLSSLNFPCFKMVMMIMPTSWYCEDNTLTQKHLAQCCVQFVLFLFPNPQEIKNVWRDKVWGDQVQINTYITMFWRNNRRAHNIKQNISKPFTWLWECSMWFYHQWFQFLNLYFQNTLRGKSSFWTQEKRQPTFLYHYY